MLAFSMYYCNITLRHLPNEDFWESISFYPSEDLPLLLVLNLSGKCVLEYYTLKYQVHLY